MLNLNCSVIDSEELAMGDGTQLLCRCACAKSATTAVFGD
jgi:hypothetical protein